MLQLGQLQGLLSAYLFTLCSNLIVGLIQYKKNKNQIQRRMVFIWISTILIILAYLLTAQIGPRISGIIAAPLVFLNFLLYSQFFSDVRKVNFSAKLPIRFFSFGYLTSIALFFFDVPFGYFALPSLLAAVFPFFLLLFYILKKSEQSLTVPQIIFLFNQLFFSILNLTWNPEFFSIGIIFWGFALSLASGQIHAIIVPIVGNDAIFKEKTDHLEGEIFKRVNELTLVRKQLWEANKNAMMGRLAGGLAHEINNSLSLINIQADLLEKKMQLKSIDENFILQATLGIHQQVQKLNNMTSSLRKIARDEGEAPKKIYNLTALIKETLVLFQDRLKKSKIDLFLNTGNEVFVRVNSSDISQVIIQLLNNSFEALDSKPGGWIRISETADNNIVFVEIEDSGTLSQEKAEQIMEPFYTNKDVTGRGLGLGLIVSKTIIEAHGGTLYLDKDSKNTKFIFTLPRSKKQIE
ncbi:MAG: sensor histidine kinase [Pseudobdellovibrionaceae bacterium]